MLQESPAATPPPPSPLPFSGAFFETAAAEHLADSELFWRANTKNVIPPSVVLCWWRVVGGELFWPQAGWSATRFVV